MAAGGFPVTGAQRVGVHTGPRPRPPAAPPRTRSSRSPRPLSNRGFRLGMIGARSKGTGRAGAADRNRAEGRGHQDPWRRRPRGSSTDTASMLPAALRVCGRGPPGPTAALRARPRCRARRHSAAQSWAAQAPSCHEPDAADAARRCQLGDGPREGRRAMGTSIHSQLLWSSI